MLGLKPHCVDERLAHAHFEEVRTTGRHGQAALHLVQAETGSRTAQEQILDRRRLEDPVVRSVNLEVDTRNEITGRDARAEGGILDQQFVTVQPHPGAQGEIPEAHLILHESAGLEAAPPVAKIQVDRGQDSGLAEREPLAHPVDTQVPARLHGVALTVERDVPHERTVAKAPGLLDPYGSRLLVAPEGAGQFTHHGPHGHEHAGADSPLVVDLPCGLSRAPVLALAGRLLNQIVRH